MHTDLERARAILSEESCTCVLCKGDVCYKSTRRGVAPLLGWLDAGLDATGFSAADKVVGKATAFLYCLLGVRSIHANVVSDASVEILLRHGIALTWDERVAAIQNRTGTGLCPMEQATRDVTEPADAPAAIRAALAQLGAKS